MLRRSYQLATLAAVAVSFAACVVLWRKADSIYRSESQVAGWRFGVTASAVPVLAMAACGLWLRWQRAHRQPQAEVRWLNAALILSASAFGCLILFSLM
jgi:chromate transport protein ChrA